MAYSINRVGQKVREGTWPPALVLELFKRNMVKVDGMEPPGEDAFWDEEEDYGAASHGLDHYLTNAGADETLIWQVMFEIDRARKEGRIQ